VRTSATPLTVAALLALPAFGPAVTIHVPGDEPTIQAGIDAASDGDTVLVACDTYYEHGITMKSGVTLRSEAGEPSCVTIDATGPTDRVFSIMDVQSCVIAGVTVTGGNVMNGAGARAVGASVTFEDCVFTGNSATRGGGLYCEDAVVTLLGCTFAGNAATTIGGGVHLDSSAAEVTDCVFDGNAAGQGGGLAHYIGVSLTVAGSTFRENTADAAGGGGGGAYLEHGWGQFIDCVFEANDGGERGGGVRTYDLVQLTLSDCTFTGNAAEYGGGIRMDIPALTMLHRCDFVSNTAVDGAGVYSFHDPGVVIQECTFTGNAAADGGGAATLNDANCDVVDSTFDHNAAARGAAVAAYDDSDVEVVGSTIVLNGQAGGARRDGAVYVEGGSVADILDSIVAFNTAGEAVVCEAGGSATLTCSLVYGNSGGDWVGCIEGQDGAVGNWHADPRFCGVLSGDYSLCSNSVCLPDNNPCLALLGAHDEGCGDCETPVERASWGDVKARWR
jgi:predicted outer membrane repeat protein